MHHCPGGQPPPGYKSIQVEDGPFAFDCTVHPNTVFCDILQLSLKSFYGSQTFPRLVPRLVLRVARQFDTGYRLLLSAKTATIRSLDTEVLNEFVILHYVHLTPGAPRFIIMVRDDQGMTPGTLHLAVPYDCTIRTLQAVVEDFLGRPYASHFRGTTWFKHCGRTCANLSSTMLDLGVTTLTDDGRTFWYRTVL